MKTEQDFYPTTNKLSMPGLYLHIPFCKQACHYCNFHFSTSLRMKGAMVEAILKELDYQRGFLLSVEKKLSNEKFVNSAPPQVIEIERKKKQDAETKIKSYEETLKNLSE